VDTYVLCAVSSEFAQAAQGSLRETRARGRRPVIRRLIHLHVEKRADDRRDGHTLVLALATSYLLVRPRGEWTSW
jgi:hypothetical protein